MITVDKLRDFGANVEEGKQRCLNDESFYITLVKMVLGDKQIPELVAAVNSGDLAKGFKIAHALKGMYGNVSLTPIYKPLCEITELLRAKTDVDYTALLTEITQKRKELEELDK